MIPMINVSLHINRSLMTCPISIQMLMILVVAISMAINNEPWRHFINKRVFGNYF